jgi:hypothetical protein
MVPTPAGWTIIEMVFFISAISSIFIAVAAYLIDKGAKRRDR